MKVEDIPIEYLFQMNGFIFGWKVLNISLIEAFWIIVWCC